MTPKPSSSDPQSLTIGLVFDDSLDRPDGVQQQVRLLSEWLCEQGHTVHLLVGETTDYQPKRAVLHSLSRNKTVKANQNTLSLPRSVAKSDLQSVFDEVNFDVIHVMLPFSPFLGRQVVKLALTYSVPLIGTFHTYPSTTWQRAGSWLYGRWLKHYLRSFAALTTVSDSAASYVQRSFNVKTQVVPNFIDIKRFKSAKPESGVKTKNKLTIIFINRLVKRKGARYLVLAASKLSPELQRQIKIIIGGRGPQQAELNQLIKHHNLNEVVELIGFVEEAKKAKFLAGAEMAVYPATGGEAFGIVLLEAMAAGALTLGSDIPGYRDVLAPVEGSLFAPADPDQLATKLTDLVQRPDLRRTLKNQQASYVEQFSVDNVGRDILALYHRAVADGLVV